nr:hypothetical protein [uncultured Lichenicoccus sp.]
MAEEHKEQAALLRKFHHLPRTDVAIDQLDWSIRLLLDHDALVPAYTLAGAAEEVLGKHLKGRSARARLKDAVGTLPDLNKLKNFLKHGNEPEMKVEALDLEVAFVIIRAGLNLEEIDGTFTSQFPRFLKWAREKHPHLFEGPEEPLS